MYLRILSIFLLSTLFAVGQASAQTEKKRGLAVEFCRPGLTEKGRQSSFRIHFRYLVTVDPEGDTDRVEFVYGKTSGLVTIDHLEECMHSWKLVYPGTYVVVFSVGTTAGPDFLSIRSEDFNLKRIL